MSLKAILTKGGKTFFELHFVVKNTVYIYQVTFRLESLPVFIFSILVLSFNGSALFSRVLFACIINGA